MHSALQSLFVSDDQVQKMWAAFRRLGLESRQLYLDLNNEFGPIFHECSGRGHLASPLIQDDNNSVLTLRDQLNAFNVSSEIVRNSTDIQDFVGKLQVRHPELMVKYPEDFVLDLHRFKSGILESVKDNSITLCDSVTSIEQDLKGNVIAVVTAKGQRIKTDFVLYAGGWRANMFLKKTLGINLNYHLNVAAGVRFLLPGHMVDRSIVCGPMFLAPGFDNSRNPTTDIGQMFLVNFTEPYPRRKHLEQALARLHTYFKYDGDILKIWNCVGRPITTTGMPFIEKVAPNMVIALGSGMFGVSIGPGVAKRALDVLLHDKTHADHTIFARKTGGEIIRSFVNETLSPSKPSEESDKRPPRKHQRVIQLGKRGAMTGVLQESFGRHHDFAVYASREIDALVQDIRTHPNSILVVASHGSQAKLPVHYRPGYIYADQAIEKILVGPDMEVAAVILISGGIPKSKIKDLQSLATQSGTRLLYFPGLAIGMEVVSNAARALLVGVHNPHRIVIEDTFHRDKRETPSSGNYGLLAEVVRRFGSEHLLILIDEAHPKAELQEQYPCSTFRTAKTDEDVRKYAREFSGLIPLIIRSHRINIPYRYQHTFTIRDNNYMVTFEQRVNNRKELVPAINAVLERVECLPPGFSCSKLSEVLPTVPFRTGASLLDGLKYIILALHEAKIITLVAFRHAPSTPFLKELLSSLSHPTTRIYCDPALPHTLHVEGNINGQSFYITFNQLTI